MIQKTKNKANEDRNCLPAGGSLRVNGHTLMAIRVVAAAVVLLTGCTAIPVADRKSQAPVCNPHVIAEVGLSSAAPYPANQPTAKRAR